MKKALLYAAVIYLLPINSASSHQRNHAQSQAVHQYAADHIMPVLLEKRQVFDAFLSADEKNKLADCRQQLNALNEKFHAAMNQRSEATPEQGASMISSEDRKSNRATMKELMSEVRAIADNHKEELDKIEKDLEPQNEIWKKDIEQLKALQQNDQAESATSSTSNHDWMNSPMFRKWSKVGFVLLNPSKTITADNQSRVTMADMLPYSGNGMHIYPNPAAEQFNLTVPAGSAENKLVITDMKGRIVTEKENVLPSETISCSNLDNGIYFIQLSSGNGVVNKKLVVSH